LGARGTGGIHESDIVLEFAAQVRTALEAQGFQVVQTRQGNANPSFDDRSAMANAQRGAIFITVHIASTGTPGTARVYVMNDMASGADATGLIPWDRAQAPFVSLSRKLGRPGAGTAGAAIQGLAGCCADGKRAATAHYSGAGDCGGDFERDRGRSRAA